MAVPALRALHGAGHDVALVVSGADKRRGRGSATSPSPVKAVATELGLPVTTEVDDVLGTEAELGVVVAFGRIIGPHVLAAVPMVNLHFSLLPRWRGAAPVERAILAGDDRTGVCVMDVDETLDTGDVHARIEVPLDDEVTAGDLRSHLAEVGATLLVDTLARGLGAGTPQADTGVTYAEKLRAEELELRWDRPADELCRTVRVGGAWTTFRGRRLKVLEARPGEEAVDGPPGTLAGTAVACGAGTALELVTVRPAGRAAAAATDWVRGARPEPGERLGS
jgi:methionyl-tRNA formyltransferase